MWTAGPIHLLFLLLSVATACAAGTGGLPQGFVYLGALEPSIVQDIRYAGPSNFTGRAVAGYEAAECILTKSAATALARAQQNLLNRGLTLKVFDCYRPIRAVADFVQWSLNEHQHGRQFYYPGLNRRSLFAMGYLSRYSSHSKGNTVDLAIARVGAQAPASSDPSGSCTSAAAIEVDGTLDFGTAYDCFSALSAVSSSQVSSEARENRRMLIRTMSEVGFRNYSREWWHFEYSPDGHLPRQDFPIVARPKGSP